MNDDTYITERDQWGNLVFYKNATGWWWRKEFDEHGNLLYREDSSGMWVRHYYDENGNNIGYENFLGFKR